LLDLGVAIARGAWLGRLDFVIIATAGMVLLSLTLAAAFRRGRLFLQNHGASLAYVSISALGAWIAAEVIVACFLYYVSGVNPFTSEPPFHTRPAGQHLVFPANEAVFPGISRASYYRTNSLGLRGPEFPPRNTSYRILTVGGSTTECTRLDDSETWQHLLMQRLARKNGRRNVWVGSAGISGYLTVNHLPFVAQSPLMKQVDAILFLIGANDFSAFLRGSLRNGVMHVETRLRLQPFWRFSPIFGMVRSRWQRREGAIEAEDFTGRNVPRRRMKRQGSRIVDSLAGLDEALQQYERRVETLVNLARGHGLRPILLTQPTLWDANLSPRGRALLWFGDISENEYLSVEAGRAGIEKYNDVLLSVCGRMGVECISTSSMNGQEQYYYDDFHFNEAGAAELARIVADYLVSRASVDDWAPAH
jgi:lysophospholipase L1-like esterase